MPNSVAVETRISLILLLYRRLDLSQAITAGQISIGGSNELARQFVNSFLRERR